MKIVKYAMDGLKWVLGSLMIALVTIYRYAISPVLHALAPGSGCRFEPSCSAYALDALKTHGPFTGGWLALKRLSRCHPWGGSGYDPVPNSCSCTSREDHQHPTLFKPSQSVEGPADEKTTETLNG